MSSPIRSGQYADLPTAIGYTQARLDALGLWS
jgi:hypothetical protein